MQGLLPRVFETRAIVHSANPPKFVRPARIELASTAPQAATLSVELRALVYSAVARFWLDQVLTSAGPNYCGNRFENQLVALSRTEGGTSSSKR